MTFPCVMSLWHKTVPRGTWVPAVLLAGLIGGGLARAEAVDPAHWSFAVDTGRAHLTSVGTATALRLSLGREWRGLGSPVFPLGIEAQLGHYGHPQAGARAQGLALDAVGRMRLTQDSSLLGRVGLSYARFSGPGTADEAELAPKLGVGLRYDVSRHLSARGQLELFQHDQDLSFVSVGLAWSL